VVIEFLEVDSAANKTPLCFDCSKPINCPPIKSQVALYPCKYGLYDSLPQCKQPLLLRIFSLGPLPLDHGLMYTYAYLSAFLVTAALSVVRACSILTTLIDSKFVAVSASHFCLGVGQNLSMRADTAVVFLVVHKL
jgi:hypothetical protein